jgi:hypothetical protein
MESDICFGPSAVKMVRDRDELGRMLESLCHRRVKMMVTLITDFGHMVPGSRSYQVCYKINEAIRPCTQSLYAIAGALMGMSTSRRRDTIIHAFSYRPLLVPVYHAYARMDYTPIV